MMHQNNSEIFTELAVEIVTEHTGTLFAIIHCGDCDDIDNAIKNADLNAEFTRTNIACGNEVPIFVINYAIQKFCTEIGTSSVYVDAPNHTKSNMIFPAGVKIIK
jgi:peroxiredoxin family protein